MAGGGHSSSSTWSSLRSISSRWRRISERLLSEVITSQHRRKRPQLEGDGGHTGPGPQLAEWIELGLFTCGGGRSVLVLCFSHITVRPIPLRQILVRRSQSPHEPIDHSKATAIRRLRIRRQRQFSGRSGDLPSSPPHRLPTAGQEVPAPGDGAARTATTPARKQPNAKIFVNFALLSSPRC